MATLRTWMLATAFVIGNATATSAQSSEWTSLHGLDGLFATALVLDSTGAVITVTGTSTIHRSTDDGQTWTEIPHPAGFLASAALAVAPDGRIIAAGDSRVYLSSDRGLTWTEGGVFDGTQPSHTVISLAVTRDGVLLAGTFERGLLRSDDMGVTWTRVETLAEITVRTVGWRGAAQLFAGTDQGLYHSTDDGASWRHDLDGTPVLAILPPRTIGPYQAGTEGSGAFRATRLGEWTESAGLPSFETVESLIHLPDGSIVATTLASGVFRSPNTGMDYEPWSEGLDNSPPLLRSLLVTRSGIVLVRGATTLHSRSLGVSSVEEAQPLPSQLDLTEAPAVNARNPASIPIAQGGSFKGRAY